MSNSTYTQILDNYLESNAKHNEFDNQNFSYSKIKISSQDKDSITTNDLNK